ncbi:hypothetical protein [Xanthomonas euvesicatoria]|uniref:hypothetical protein n=1 Tax=Xanthomonas euvesicatoria TaxID=456327 RepID=UPI001C440F58|nr:hypothetical protein [Xanthomonas euvesicatoria]MBV6805586.1 hypothetical protein [Xanthomonas campestris pv. convolvuli]
MSNPDEPSPKGLGRFAQWAAAPYCAFKNDEARLHALISRDVRFVLIAAFFAVTGTRLDLPWRSLMLTVLTSF